MPDDCLEVEDNAKYHHDTDTDKHGESVSRFVTEALDALRDDPYVGKAICDNYRTGRLQVFFVKKYVQGETIRTAREHDFELAFATARSGDTQQYASWDTIGYAELLPDEHVDR